MKPYCPNNSNFTFREITCTPVKKPCDKPKPPLCNEGCGWCEELINCLLPNNNLHHNNCDCNGRHNTCNSSCKNNSNPDFAPPECTCPKCRPLKPPCNCHKCCPPCPPLANHCQQKRPIVLIFKK